VKGVLGKGRRCCSSVGSRPHTSSGRLMLLTLQVRQMQAACAGRSALLRLLPPCADLQWLHSWTHMHVHVLVYEVLLVHLIRRWRATTERAYAAKWCQSVAITICASCTRQESSRNGIKVNGIIIIMFNQAIASTPSAPRPSGAEGRGSTAPLCLQLLRTSQACTR
jgi:hypothetical protein